MKPCRASYSNPIDVAHLPLCRIRNGRRAEYVDNYVSAIWHGTHQNLTALQDTLLEALVKREDVDMLTAVSNGTGSSDSGLGAFHFMGLSQ